MESSHAEQPPHIGGDQPLTNVLAESSIESAAPAHLQAQEQPEQLAAGAQSETSPAEVQPAEEHGEDQQMPIGTNIEVDVGCHRSVTSCIHLSINPLSLEF